VKGSLPLLFALLLCPEKEGLSQKRPLAFPKMPDGLLYQFFGGRATIQSMLKQLAFYRSKGKKTEWTAGLLQKNHLPVRALFVVVPSCILDSECYNEYMIGSLFLYD